LAQRPHLPYSNKLFSDPTGLGRYMNYRGASSKIAQYIKSLEPTVRAAFVVEKSPPIKTARYTPKISENLKLKIDRNYLQYLDIIRIHQRIGIMNLKQLKSKVVSHNQCIIIEIYD
jgi:hypothetical protein